MSLLIHRHVRPELPGYPAAGGRTPHRTAEEPDRNDDPGGTRPVTENEWWQRGAYAHRAAVRAVAFDGRRAAGDAAGVVVLWDSVE